MPRQPSGFVGFMVGAGAMVKDDGSFEIGGVHAGSYYVTAMPSQGRMSALGRVAVDVARERALDQPRNAFADESAKDFDVEPALSELFEHRVRRCGEIRNRVEQRAVEIDRDAFHGESRFRDVQHATPRVAASFFRIAPIVPA